MPAKRHTKQSRTRNRRAFRHQYPRLTFNQNWRSTGKFLGVTKAGNDIVLVGAVLVDRNKYRPHTGKKQLAKYVEHVRRFGPWETPESIRKAAALLDATGTITTEELTAFVNEVNDVIDNAE